MIPKVQPVSGSTPLTALSKEPKGRRAPGSPVAKAPEDIRVVIYDQEYHMRGQLDPDYIHKLAKFLDGKMRSIAERTHTVDSLRVAVLAGLNIADEYHQMKARLDSLEKQVDERLHRCQEAVDQILRQVV
jgi:cell division protein ZapA